MVEKALLILDVAINCLNFPSPSFSPTSNISTKNSLVWTADICNAVEIIYALFHSKCINNGEATLKQITESFEKVFNLKIQNISHQYLRIRGRKISERSAFINKLQDNLIKAMTVADK